MGDKDKSKNTYVYTVLLISILLILIALFLIVKYFRTGVKITNVLPRLTLDLYDDLGAFMQYDY